MLGLLALVSYLVKIWQKLTRGTNKFAVYHIGCFLGSLFLCPYWEPRAIVHTTINFPFLYLVGFPFIFPVPFCTAAQVLWAHGRLKIKKRMGVLTDEDNIFKELLNGGCCCGSCKVLEDARVLKNAPLYDAVATEPTSNNMTRDNS